MDTVTCDEEHIYRVGGLPRPGVTEILQRVGIIDTYFYKEGDAERGQRVHAATVKVEKCEPYVVLPEEEGYLSAYRDFLAKTGWQSIHAFTERGLYDPRWLFCGTLDRFGWITQGHKRILALLDIKTGSSPWWAKYQIGGYKILIESNRDMLLPAGAWNSYSKEFPTFVVQLSKTGKFALHPVEMAGGVAGFMAARSVYTILNRKK